jgi:hypothetical protein
VCTCMRGARRATPATQVESELGVQAARAPRPRLPRKQKQWRRRDAHAIAEVVNTVSKTHATQHKASHGSFVAEPARADARRATRPKCLAVALRKGDGDESTPSVPTHRPPARSCWLFAHAPPPNHGYHLVVYLSLRLM